MARVLVRLLFVTLFGVSLAQAQTPEQAAAHVRGLVLSREFDMAAREGQALSSRFAGDAEISAWTIIGQARSGESDAALEWAERLVSFEGENPWTWFAKAGALAWHPEHSPEAAEASDKALALYPDHPDYIWLHAQALINGDRPEKALDFLNQFEADVQKNPELICTRAAALVAADPRSDSARAAAGVLYEQALRLDPDNISALYMGGLNLMDRGRPTEAYDLLKRAASLSDGDVHYQYWQASLKNPRLSPEARRKEILDDVNAYLQIHRHSARAMQLAASMYGELKLADRKRDLQDRILKSYPTSAEAEWILTNRARAFEATVDFPRDRARMDSLKSMLRSIINRPDPKVRILIGDAYMMLFFALQQDSTSSASEILEAAHGMIRFNNANVHVSHATAARELAERKSHFREAEQLAKDGIEAARKQLEKDRRFYTEDEYETALKANIGLMQDALGWVYFNEGRLDAADFALSRALDLNPKNEMILYHLGRYHEARQNLDRAEQYYILSLQTPSFGKKLAADALQSLYLERRGSLTGYDSYLASLDDIYGKLRHSEILKERLSRPRIFEHFRLKTMDGGEVTFESLKGKTVVVNFWGTWCEACLQQLPQYEQLFERYRNDASVAILTINNDPLADEVRAWMRDSGYDVPALIDDGYLARAGITSFPTTWFIGPDGKIAYEKIGGSEKLQEEYTWRIESLKYMPAETSATRTPAP